MVEIYCRENTKNKTKKRKKQQKNKSTRERLGSSTSESGSVTGFEGGKEGVEHAEESRNGKIRSPGRPSSVAPQKNKRRRLKVNQHHAAGGLQLKGHLTELLNASFLAQGRQRMEAEAVAAGREVIDFCHRLSSPPTTTQ